MNSGISTRGTRLPPMPLFMTNDPLVQFAVLIHFQFTIFKENAYHVFNPNFRSRKAP